MILTYKYQLKGKRCFRQLRRFAYVANQVWNYCVQTQRKIQQNREDGLSPKRPSHFDLAMLVAVPPRIFTSTRSRSNRFVISS